MTTTVPVSGVWLRKTAGRDGAVTVAVEVDGEWRAVITETVDDGPVSHIVEAAGILAAPKDEL